MNLANVMDELGSALTDIEGLRVYPYWNAGTISPPCAVVGWPDPITFDMTMARGADRQTMPIHILVGKVDARTARDLLAQYIDGSGTTSLKEAIESYEATSYDSARVMQGTVGVIQVGAVDYLSVTFDVDVVGRGA